MILRRKNKAMTLVEILVALGVSLAFLSGVLMAFMQIMKTTDASKARLSAVNNARSALEIMSMDIKLAKIDRTHIAQDFVGVDNGLSFGNGQDDDNDGRVDEEVSDGDDDDGDWGSADDIHLDVNGFYERTAFRARPDIGDKHVDEDRIFNRDSISFRIFPDPGNPSSRDERITYEVVDDIAAYGEPNVLIRRVVKGPDTSNPMTEVSPIAFNVLSLDFLYWNPNTVFPYWTTSWNASAIPPLPTNIPIPISVYISITVNADIKDIKLYTPGTKIETISLQTVVNVEQALNDSRWR